MQSNHTSNTTIAPGPDTKRDINMAESSFADIAGWLEQFPDICRVPSATRKSDAFLINDPDLVKRVLIDNHRNYIKGPGIERVKLLLGNGIIVSDGEHWKRQRRMVQPSFHRSMLKQLSSIMQAESRTLLKRLQQFAAEQKVFNLSEVMSEFGLQVILQSLFSVDLQAMCEQENPFSIFTQHSERNLNLAVQFRALRQLMLSVIEQRRTTGCDRMDMLASLMQATDLQGQSMSDEDLLDELMTLIVAGHETSAVTLTWVWYLLARNPEVERKLQHEVDSMQPAEQGCPNFEQAGELAYCRQVMFEALRLYPPVWLLSRKAIENDHIGPYAIPAGSDIFISPYFLHRRPDHWPDPEAFDPERFEQSASEQHHRLAFIPFSGGPRKCIGDVFSILEIQIHMGTIARLIQLRLNEPQELDLEPAINLRNKHPIWVVAENR